MYYYRWVVIENSLKNRSLLQKYQVLSETTFAENEPDRKSRMLKLRVPEQDVEHLSDILSNNIIFPYYTHLYPEDPENKNLIIIFSGQKFVLKKYSYQEAVDYGLAHQVTAEEMRISPLEVADEDW